MVKSSDVSKFYIRQSFASELPVNCQSQKMNNKDQHHKIEKYLDQGDINQEKQVVSLTKLYDQQLNVITVRSLVYFRWTRTHCSDYRGRRSKSKTSSSTFVRLSRRTRISVTGDYIGRIIMCTSFLLILILTLVLYLLLLVVLGEGGLV